MILINEKNILIDMKNNFPFNPFKAYAKVYHDKAKEMGCTPEDVKLLMNSIYGG